MSDWPILQVSELAVQRGLIGGPFGSSLVSRDYVANGTPVIRGTNMPASQSLIGGPFVFVSEEKAKSLARNQAVPGDVVFTQRGTLGQVGLVPAGSYDSYVVSQSQMRLRVDAQIATPEYVYWVFRSPHIVAHVRGLNTATANPHINLGILAKIEIPVPPIPEQRRIVAVMSAVDAHIEALSEESNRLDATRVVQLEAVLDRAGPGSITRLGDLVELVYGRALRAEDRLLGPVPVFGAAGTAGMHTEANSGVTMPIIVGRKGADARTFRSPVRDEDSSSRGWGGAGSVRWCTEPHWVIDTAYAVLNKTGMDDRALYWLLVAADLPRVATKTTLPGLSRARCMASKYFCPERLTGSNQWRLAAPTNGQWPPSSQHSRPYAPICSPRCCRRRSQSTPQ